MNVAVAGCSRILFEDCTLGGSSAFGTGSGVRFVTDTGGLTYEAVRFRNCELSATASPLVAHAVTDVSFDDSAGTTAWTLFFDHCIFAKSPEFTNHLTLANAAYIALDDESPVIHVTKKDQTTGSHVSYYGWRGTVQASASVFHTVSPSMELIPISATRKLVSPKRQVAVASGSVTVSVWVQKSAAYNGAAPRLIAKRGDAIGITADTVLGTFSAAADTWEELSGSVSPTDDGVLEVVVDCDGTAGSVYVDDWSVS